MQCECACPNEATKVYKLPSLSGGMKDVAMCDECSKWHRMDDPDDRECYCCEPRKDKS